MAQSWCIGQVKITRIVESQTPVPYHPKYPYIREATPEAVLAVPWLQPDFATDDGLLRASVHSLLVQTPSVNLIVDTCIGNDKPRRMTGRRALQTRFLARLQEAGCPRTEVSHVVCTHLHVDHVGWNTMLQADRWVPTFPNARYLIGRQEMAFWSSHDKDAEQTAVVADSVQPIVDAALCDLVETDHVIDDCVRLRPSPGHTPGHVSIDINSDGHRAMISGDFVHHPCQMAHPSWATPFDADRALATQTRNDLFELLADSDVLLIGTHFPTPTAGYVQRDGDGYRLSAERRRNAACSI